MNAKLRHSMVGKLSEYDDKFWYFFVIHWFVVGPNGLQSFVQTNNQKWITSIENGLKSSSFLSFRSRMKYEIVSETFRHFATFKDLFWWKDFTMCDYDAGFMLSLWNLYDDHVIEMNITQISCLIYLLLFWHDVDHC